MERFTTCGKPNCCCARGERHGPFYDLPDDLRAVRDTRFYPAIPTAPVILTLFQGALLRVPSFHQTAKTVPGLVGDEWSSGTGRSTTV